MEERKNPSFQIEISSVSGVNEEIDENKTKCILENCKFNERKWHPHNRNSLCRSFYFVNDNSKITFNVPQTICYLFLNSYYF